MIAGIALLQILYWAVFVLFLPPSVVLIPLTGFWLITLVSCFFLYDAVNETFHLEERIQAEHPEQVPFYETDEMYLARKQKEGRF